VDYIIYLAIITLYLISSMKFGPMLPKWPGTTATYLCKGPWALTEAQGCSGLGLDLIALRNNDGSEKSTGPPVVESALMTSYFCISRAWAIRATKPVKW